jgi:hypothetical protein
LRILNTKLEDLEINDENVVSSLEELKKVYTLLKNA